MARTRQSHTRMLESVWPSSSMLVAQTGSRSHLAATLIKPLPIARTRWLRTLSKTAASGQCSDTLVSADVTGRQVSEPEISLKRFFRETAKKRKLLEANLVMLLRR